MERQTITVDLPVRVPGELSDLSKTFSSALLGIDSLYKLQLDKALSYRQEKSLWEEIPKVLQSADIPESQKGLYERQLKNLEKGIFDLYPITVGTNDSEIDLIVGKVFGSEGGRVSYFSGAAGVANENYKKALKGYDSKLDVLCGQLIGSADEAESILEKAPKIRCLDVFSLSGALNVAHKPICVFFSGENTENISTLSNMSVFINIYSARFKALTMEIARHHMNGAEQIVNLNDTEVSDLLLIWLRGHDIGHFIGEDNLGKRMSQFDKDYMILHELKADMVALYSFGLYKHDLMQGGLLEKIYILTFAEMLRYMRRGDLMKYPDSASAYLAWRYFEQTGVITYDHASGKFDVNMDMLKDAVDNFVKALIHIFRDGNTAKARELVRRYGTLTSLSDNDPFPDYCPGNLRNVLADRDIAYYIDYNFKTG